MSNTEIPRLSRLNAILTLLQSKRIVTAADIAEKFGVSKRTAYRDIRALEQSGIPIYTEEGKGYSLVDGFALPPVMFTEEEANALITAEVIVSRNRDRSLVEHHKSAIDKVKAVLRYSSKDKANLLADRLFFMKNFKSEFTSNNLSTLQSAITNMTLLFIRYQSVATGEFSERTIEPTALYHSSDNWILIAWCQLRQAYREFRLDKIEQLSLLDQRFEDRKFDLSTYFIH